MKNSILLFATIAFFALTVRAQNWVPLDKGLNATIYHLLPDPDNSLLYASGDIISDCYSVPMKGIVKWDGIKWDSVGDYAHNPYMTMDGFCKFQDTLFASGYFPEDGWHPHLGKLRGLRFETIPNTIDLDVYCFLERNGILYMGGWFNKCGNDPTYLLGKYDGVTFTGMTPLYDGYSPGDVITCMTFYNDTLYVGGNFHMSPQPNIADFAKWDGYNLLTVTPEYNSGYCMIETMAVFQNELYIGGTFSKSYGFIGDFIMKWDGHHLYEVGGGTNDRVTCMKVFNNELYVGGWFTEVDGSPCNNIAKWNGTQWTSLNNDAFNGVFPIRDICIYNNELYVAGCFITIGNDTMKNVAKYNHPLIGIKENIKSENDFSIYPNPSTDKIIIDCSPNREMNISIYNLIGDLVLQSIMDNDKKEIDINAFVTGMYIIKATGIDWTEQKKFIKE